MHSIEEADEVDVSVVGLADVLTRMFDDVVYITDLASFCPVGEKEGHDECTRVCQHQTYSLQDQGLGPKRSPGDPCSPADDLADGSRVEVRARKAKNDDE